MTSGVDVYHRRLEWKKRDATFTEGVHLLSFAVLDVACTVPTTVAALL